MLQERAPARFIFFGAFADAKDVAIPIRVDPDRDKQGDIAHLAGFQLHGVIVGASRLEFLSPVFEISFAVKRLFPDDAVSGLRRWARCLVPGSDGIALCSDPSWRKSLWDKFYTIAPRPRTRSEKRYSDRKLRSRS